MTWDKNRPYIPIDMKNGRYSFFGHDDPTDNDIEQMYATGSWNGKPQRSWNGKPEQCKYVPFKRVRMSLMPIMLSQDRYGIWWMQGNDMFHMSGSEFERIMTEMSPKTLPMDGLWSATRKKAPSPKRISQSVPPTFYYDIVLEELFP